MRSRSSTSSSISSIASKISRNRTKSLNDEDLKPVYRAPERSPTTWRQFLVPRYSRYRDATVIFYGEIQYALSSAMIQKHLRVLHLHFKASTSTAGCMLSIGACADAYSVAELPQGVVTQLRALECEIIAASRLADRWTDESSAQLIYVLDLWDELAHTIARGAYEPLLEDACESYCTNALDVFMVNELDTLFILDRETAKLLPQYERLFSRRYTGVDCACPTCKPAATFLKDLKTLALSYHASVEPAIFERVFSDLDICRTCMPTGYEGRGLPVKRCYLCIHSNCR